MKNVSMFTHLLLACVVAFTSVQMSRGVAASSPSSPSSASDQHTIYLPWVASSPIKILWTDACDPRADPKVCQIGPPEILNEIYSTINSVNAIVVYTLPTSVNQLLSYDVVVADYCSALYPKGLTPLIAGYVQRGGSVIALGDNFCIVGGDAQGNVSSAKAANQLTASRGITFTDDDDATVRWSSQVISHPTTLGIPNDKIYAFRHAYLTVTLSSTAVVKMGERDLIAVYDGANGDGTMVAIPDIGFHWGSSFQQVSQSDNFVFWRNTLRWLAQKAQQKRAGQTLTDSSPPMPATSATNLSAGEPDVPNDPGVKKVDRMQSVGPWTERRSVNADE